MRGKAIALLTGMVIGMAIGSGITLKSEIKKRIKVREFSDKHLDLFILMNQWMKIKQKGKNLSAYFERNGYKKIAIYGMSYVGETLMNELKGTGIEVSYGIDKNADKTNADIEVVSVDALLERVDAIVVTAITYFDEVQEMLSQKVDCKIISLEDVIYDL